MPRERSTPQERRLRLKFALQMTVVLAIYIPVLLGSIELIEANPDAWWRFAVALLPLTLFIAGALTVLRYVLQEDELEQRISLMALSIAFASTAIFTFAYGLLQIAGAPDASWTLVWPVMGVSWLIGGIVARRRYR